ncbi:titin homolog, partial [Limulus polyphemus]|uniref:Titin homolog n=1 Tax=Limulus polyphemus TaxID=6850 RepID=A0ABM1TR31_LIMPO
MAEAIMLGILDIKTGQYKDFQTGKHMSLQDAISKGLANDDFVNNITKACGIIDIKTGTELTLIQAIEKGLFDPDKGTFLDPKKRKPVTIDEAIQLGILKKDKVQKLFDMKIVKMSKLTITEAVQKRLLDTQTGQFKDPKTNQSMSLNEAFDKEYLEIDASVHSEGGISLAEALDRGMVNEKAGLIVDKESGERFTIDEATRRGIIRCDVREVVNMQSGEIVNVPQSIFQGVINAQSGRYINKATQECLTLQQAYDKQFILRPLTLKDAYELELLDETGKVTNPITKQKLTILDAIAKGILNTEVKSIIHPKSEELLTLPEALKRGVLTSDGQFVDFTGETISLSQAVNKGLITSVCHKMIFDIEGIKNPITDNDISFNTAVSKGFIDLKIGKFKDTTKGETMTLEEATTKRFIQPQVAEMMNQKIGLKDNKGKELTVFQAVIKGLLDPKTGQVRELKTKKPVPLKEAVEKKIITPEGAAVLKSLLNITVTMATVTKTVTRYVTVTSQGKTSDVKITFQDAMRNGLIDEIHGTFKEPNNGEIMPLEEAINRGILGLTSEWPTKSSQEIPKSPTEIHTTRFHRTTIGEFSTLTQNDLLLQKTENTLKDYPSTPKESLKKGSSAVESPRKEIPGLPESKESSGKKSLKSSKKSPTKEIPEPTRQDSSPKKPSSFVKPDEYQLTDEKLQDFKQVIRHNTTDELVYQQPLSIDKPETQSPKEKLSTPAKKETGKGKQPSPIKEKPAKERQPYSSKEEPSMVRKPSPTKEELTRERQPSPTKEEPTKERQPSPIKEEPGKGRKPSPMKEEPTKERQPSPIKEEPGKGRKSSPMKEEPTKERQPSPTKEEPGKERKSSPMKEEPTKERQPSPTKEGLSKGKQPTQTKEEPSNIKKSAPEKEELTKGRQPSPNEEPMLTKEETGKIKKPHPTKEESSVGWKPSPIMEEPGKKHPPPTKGELERKVTSAATELERKTLSPTKEIPTKRKSETERKSLSPNKEIPIKESFQSPTKHEPDRKVTSPVREPESKTSPIKEPLAKGKSLSPIKDEPNKIFTSPVREPERKTSPTKEPLAKERTPSPTKEETDKIFTSSVKERERKSSKKEIPTKGRSPSPTKEEPGKTITFPVREPERKASKKELPLKGTLSSPTKEEPEKIVTSPIKEPDRKISPLKEPLTKERSPSPIKDKPGKRDTLPNREPERETSPTKEPLTTKRRSPSPTTEEPEKIATSPVKEPGRKMSPLKESLTKERSPSPIKDKPGKKVTLPNREPERETSPTKEPLTTKRRSPSPTKEEPEKIATSPVKEPERKISSKKGSSPSPTKEEPEKIATSPIKEPERKFSSKKGRSPSPTKEEPEKIATSPIKEPERKISSKKGRSPSPTKEEPEKILTSNEESIKGKSPLPIKYQPIKKYSSSIIETETKTPSNRKEILLNGRIPSPVKVEPEKNTVSSTRDISVECSKIERFEQKSETSHLVYTNGIKETTMTSLITKNVETFEVPPDGWFLKEAIDQKLFDADTGLFTVPGTDRLVSFEETIRMEIINPKSAIVVEPSSKHTVSLLRSLEKGILDPTGHYIDSKTKKKITMKEAIKKKCVILEERINVVQVTQQRTKMIHITQMDGQSDKVTVISEEGLDKPVLTQWEPEILSDTSGFLKTAVEEKYKLSGDNILKLLRWIEEVEERLANLEQVQENITELQKQAARARDIKDDLDDHQRPVTTCLDKVRQIVEQGGEVLSKDEVEQLQKDSYELKKRYDKTCEESEKLLRHLFSTQEQLEKFNMELLTFREWLNEAERKLEEQEKNLSKVDNAKETFKAFTNDVIAHQADLRFITMIAQKFVNESKEYLKILNNFRTNLPQRRAYIEPKENEVKALVNRVGTTYHNLLNRVNHLNEKFSRVIEKQQYYSECLEKVTVWLQDMKKTSRMLLDEPIAADPGVMQDQLDKIKKISLDIVGQSQFIENAKQSGKALLNFLEGTEVSIIEETLKTLEDEYYTLSNETSEKCNELQTTLVQSQDIQDGLDRLIKWLDEAESTFRAQNKAISLFRERLDEQLREYKVLQTDIDTQKPSINAVTDSAKNFTDSSNQRLAKKVETKVKDINTRFDKLCEKSSKRGELIDEVVTMLTTYDVMIVQFEEWIQGIIETIESRELMQLGIEEYYSRIEEVMNMRNVKKEDFEEVIKIGKTLVSKKDVTDTTPIKDKIKYLEQQWKDLGDKLVDKQQAGKNRAQQLSAYETLRIKILEWLINIENRVEKLDVVAIDKDVLQRQATEVKLLIKEHTDYGTTIDKVNDLGNSYDAILHGNQGDSQFRRSGSPTKKTSSSPVVAPSSPIKKSPTSEYT